MASTTLQHAKIAKEDEFYTKLTDIEKELRHYKQYFMGKTVFCNCDDPEESNFWKYFELNFEELGLKKLIATHFETEKPSYKLELMADINGDGKITGKDIVRTELRQNGDFRSPECIEILKEADIVITNPPFSLFRQFVAQLIEYNKQFLIIGNQNAITYKEIFKLLQDNKMWLGYNNGDMEFIVPDYYEPRATRYREENGIKYRSMGNTCWFSNLDVAKRHENIPLFRKYNPIEFPKYDNYEAIECSRVENIPIDYNGIIGVPITFMYRYNPEQFEILGLSQKVGYGLESIKLYDDFRETRQDGTLTGSSGKKTNGNPVMKGKPSKGNYYVCGDEIVYSLYGRIFIRKRGI